MSELIPLERIDGNPWQTRPIDPAHARLLADDIKANGLLQAPVGRIMLHGHLVDPALYGGAGPALLDEPEARVHLALGHHRLAAYRLLAEEDGGPEGPWGRLPLEIRQLDSFQMALAAWSENEKRRDTNPLERAKAIERMVHDFGWGQALIAEKLGVSRPVVANSLRLLGLPAEVQGRLASGELSERQAMALLPLYELPKGALTRLEKSYNFPRPSHVIENAGERASDRIREDVGRILANATLQLDNVPWAAIEFDEAGLKARVCENCGERMHFEKTLRCPHQTCYERKAALWAAQRLALASTAMGIQSVPEPAPQYNEWTALTNVPHPEQVIEKRCPNLRLRWVGDDRNTVTRVRVAEFPDVEVICLHGKDGKCTCGRAAKAAATRADPDIQEQKAIEKRIKTEIVEPAHAAVLAALECGDLGVWRELALKVAYSLHIPDDADLPWLRAAVARGLIDRNVYLPAMANLGQVKQSYEARLKDMGLAAPWAVTQEEGLSRRLERVARWVRDEGWWKWDYECNLEAIAGNQVNLATMAAEAAEIKDEGGRQQAEELRSFLERLEPVAREINEIHQQRGCWWGRSMPRAVCSLLLTREPGGLEFEHVLSEAPAVLVRYALCFEMTLERSAALYARLVELEPVGVEPFPVL